MRRKLWKLNLTGQRFERLVVVQKCSERGKGGEVYWLCKCDCGAEVRSQASPLKMGRTKSCGCLSRDRTRKHGMEGTPTYNAWAHMLTRCRNEKHKQWKDYGGRGIKVCDRWMSFDNFLADLGEKPKGKSLDRIDNDGDYEPSNCRWANQRQQVTNRRMSPRYEWKGEIRSLSELAEQHGLKWRRVYERVRAGWSIEDALTVKRGNRWMKKG